MNEVAKTVVNAVNDGKQKEELERYLENEPSVPTEDKTSENDEIDLSDIPF